MLLRVAIGLMKPMLLFLVASHQQPVTSSRVINPYLGSMPIERLRSCPPFCVWWGCWHNLVRRDQPVLYDRVIGCNPRTWKWFLDRHEDTFIVFPDPTNPYTNRIRLVSHLNWWRGDAQSEYERFIVEQHLRHMLCTFLCSDKSIEEARTVDDFIREYDRVTGNPLQWTGEDWCFL